MVQVLGRPRAERLVQATFELRVRALVMARDHVRDPEVGVVDDAREPVGGESAARARRRPRGTRSPRSLCLDRPLVPAHAEPLEVGEDRASSSALVDPEQQRPAALVRERAARDRGKGVAEGGAGARSGRGRSRTPLQPHRRSARAAAG